MYRYAILLTALLVFSGRPTVAQSGGLDFTISVTGRAATAAGFSTHLRVGAQVVSGADDSAWLRVEGLPSGVTASWPTLGRCCQTFAWRISEAQVLSLSVSPVTQPGTYPLRIVYTSFSGVERSTGITLTVTPLPAQTAPPVYRPAPDLPAVADWRSRMLTYGAKHCVASEATIYEANAWYYDGTRVYQQIAEQTGDPKWLACSEMLNTAYRQYVFDANGALPGWRVFPHGLAMHYRRTGDPLSLKAAQLMRSASPWTQQVVLVPDVISAESSREIAYAADTLLVNEGLDAQRNPRLRYLIDVILGHFDQWFLARSRAVQPFMVALSAEALIDWYELTGDPRVPDVLRTAADWLWLNSWDEASGSFPYLNGDGTADASPDMNLLIVPIYGWVYRQTGLDVYRERGDKVFTSGVAKAWLDGGKQFSHNYRWSARYLEWRNPPASAGTVPTSIWPADDAAPWTVAGTGCDAGSYTGAKRLRWTAQARCTVTVPARSGDTGQSRRRFTGWSDGSPLLARDVTASPDTSYWYAGYVREELVTARNGAGTVTFTPASVDGFYPDGTLVRVSATGPTGQVFQKWVSGQGNGPEPLIGVQSPVTFDAAWVPAPQPAGCTGSKFNPSSVAAPPAGGSFLVVLTANAMDCNWAAVTNGSWIVPQNASGTGSAMFYITVGANTSGAARSGWLTAGGGVFIVTQSASVNPLVERVYMGMLNRAPMPDEVSSRATAAVSLDGQAGIVTACASSPEYRGGSWFAAALYRALLDREPEYSGWKFQRDALRFLRTDQLIEGFLNSPEYNLRGDMQSDDATFVTRLYQVILGRTPTPPEVAFQVGSLGKTITRTGMVAAFLQVPEFELKYGDRLKAFLLYATLLNREPTAAEMAAMQGLSLDAAARVVLGGGEFQAALASGR